ncbi:hypothetical protein LRP52_43950 [Photobacterium sp. ZSDE20]|uniref:Uncharacterized protein n=1 Tax=Photobacterium pectinilyticum TaxID=2906793 RepID=A0ABT1N8H2_9GAMM|nr:hypothetical protein [Photobacterium sp. ZSDE20]MCQ1061033.1 hypothetical protein [Photobacterium sp. ZSDE20]MDD1829125.1 hypothetical protein [Photobacterium sp. ZSDE20]
MGIDKKQINYEQLIISEVPQLYAFTTNEVKLQDDKILHRIKPSLRNDDFLKSNCLIRITIPKAIELADKILESSSIYEHCENGQYYQLEQHQAQMLKNKINQLRDEGIMLRDINTHLYLKFPRCLVREKPLNAMIHDDYILSSEEVNNIITPSFVRYFIKLTQCNEEMTNLVYHFLLTEKFDNSFLIMRNQIIKNLKTSTMDGFGTMNGLDNNDKNR